MMNGSYSGNGKIQRYQARKLKVKSFPRMKVMADGIALGKGSVTIKMHPGAVRVITGRKILVPESSSKEEAGIQSKSDTPPVDEGVKEIV